MHNHLKKKIEKITEKIEQLKNASQDKKRIKN